MDDSSEKDQSSSPETIEVRKDTPSAPPQPVVSSDTPPPPPQAVVAHHGGGKKRWLKRLLALLLVIVLVAAGWFIYDRFIKAKPSAAPSAQSKDIPLLKIGMEGADYGSFYPAMSTNEHAYIVNAQVFEGLVRYEDKSKIVPDLASDWSNPDGKTWIFNLKNGIKFHDGNTVGADDVKYSIDTVKANNPDLTEIYASTIASVDVVDSDTVKITTTEPDPALLNKLAWLYVIDAQLPKGDNPSLAGTGPYQLKAGTKPTSTDVQLTAFNGYHGGKPHVQALAFGSGDDSDALVKGFQQGKFNIVGPVPPADARKVNNAHTFVSLEPNVYFLGMNSVKAGPLQNKQVREAIRYAVSPSSIADASGKQATLLSQLIPEAIPGHNPAIKPYKQDVDKAKQLLADAGYPNGLTLAMATTSDTKQIDAIVTELKAVGITVNVDRHDDFDEFIDYFSSGKAELFLVDYASDTLDGLDVYQTTLIKDNYSNSKVDDLLAQAGNETDPAKRLKLLQQVGTIVDQDVAVVPLYELSDVWLMDQPYKIQQDLPSAYISVYFSKVQKQ
jgi:peptide/nickel transport system substrate-binding protein